MLEGPHFLGEGRVKSGGVFGYFCLCGDKHYVDDMMRYEEERSTPAKP
jgi:hypothetical protein